MSALLQVDDALGRILGVPELDQEPRSERVDLLSPMEFQDRSNDPLLVAEPPKGVAFVSWEHRRGVGPVREHDGGETPRQGGELQSPGAH